MHPPPPARTTTTNDPSGSVATIVNHDSPRVFVPEEFTVPRRLETPLFVLEPLGPQHNDEDYAAW